MGRMWIRPLVQRRTEDRAADARIRQDHNKILRIFCLISNRTTPWPSFDLPSAPKSELACEPVSPIGLRCRRRSYARLAAPELIPIWGRCSGPARRPWNSGPPFQLVPAGSDQSARRSPIMRRAQPASIFSHGWMIGRRAFLTLAVLGLLAAPSRSPAQDAGVSGIPPGPANARGLNGSVNDPSGIGNAARVPAIAPPTITPVTPPALSSSGTYRALPAQRAVRIRRTRRFAKSRSRRAARTAHAAVGERERQLDRKMSICRGC
jgi:hypothetical protein